ncbi:hypothetical protein PCAR4_350157 [Paraburkholderia caribensis]|nr:hypothetical protein PCAR4_350157 [Paraburkholderia caribensis]
MRKPLKPKVPRHARRQDVLTARRNVKMASSTHAYVRGNTIKFYDWLKEAEIRGLPEGPAIWICGDCHTGNLGPIANSQGKIEVQIRDLDQTVIGNPVHDLVRLGLSLATAARGSALLGITTINMIEALFEGYLQPFSKETASQKPGERPEVVRVVMREAVRRTWKHLARERLDDMQPTIPCGNRFWPISQKERAEIESLFQIHTLA